MGIIALLTDMVGKGASDVFIVAGRPIAAKISGVISNWSDEMLMPDKTWELLAEIYALSGERDMEAFLRRGDDDFSFSVKSVARFRVSAYKQRGSLAAVIRVVSFTLPNSKDMHIPDPVVELSDVNKGLILVTGPAGCGKSTTLACMIDRINTGRSSHIITLEDPIEFTHSHKKSIISQREVALDTDSYVIALRAALRQSPDVILIGELRETETIGIAMTAAETGHLVISTLHTLGAANTVDRIVDVFPVERQGQIRMQLSMVLNAVVSQQLIPAKDGGVIPAFEVMHCTTAIRNMIREGKTHQIDSVITSSAAQGMVSMNTYLQRLYGEGKIEKDVAIEYSFAPEALRKALG